MSFSELTKLFGKNAGQVNLFDRPKTTEDMKHYLLALEKNKRCKSPNWDCEDGLVCDASNFFNKPSGDGVCISQKTADERKFKQITYKGHKIVGSAKTIEQLQNLLKKDSDSDKDSDKDSDSDSDKDSDPKLIKCKSPEWCEGDFVCDVSTGYPGVCIPSDKYDKSLSTIDFNGRKIVGTKSAIKLLKSNLNIAFTESFVSAATKYLSDINDPITIDEFLEYLEPVENKITSYTLTEKEITTLLNVKTDISRKHVYNNLYIPWMNKSSSKPLIPKPLIPKPMTPKEPSYPPPVTPPITPSTKTPSKKPSPKSPIKDKRPEDGTPVGEDLSVDDVEDVLKKIQLPEDQKIDKLAKLQLEILKCLGLTG